MADAMFQAEKDELRHVIFGGLPNDKATDHVDALDKELHEFERHVAEKPTSIGLSESEVALARLEHGTNELRGGGKPVSLLGFVGALRLVEATFLLGLLRVSSGPRISLVAVALYVVIRRGLYIRDEYRRDKSAANHKDDGRPTTTSVFRNGVLVPVQTKELVPGDIVCLDAHLDPDPHVPADGRVIASDARFQVVEVHPSGQSGYIHKSAGGMLYALSRVRAGKAYMEVTKTGSGTEFGRALLDAGRNHFLDPPNPPTNYFEDVPKIITRILLVAAAPILALVCVVWYLRSPLSCDILLACLMTVLLSTAASLRSEMASAYRACVAQLAEIGAICQRPTAVDDLARMDVLCSTKSRMLMHDKFIPRTPLCVAGTTPDEILLAAGLTLPPTTCEMEGTDVCILEAVKQNPTLEKHLSTFTRVDYVPFDTSMGMSGSISAAADGDTIISIRGRPMFLLKAIIGSSGLPQVVQREYWDVVANLEAEGSGGIGLAQKVNDGPWQILGVLPMSIPIRAETHRGVQLSEQLDLSLKLFSRDTPRVAKLTAEHMGLGSNILDLKQVDLDQVLAQPISGTTDLVLAANGFANFSSRQECNIVEILQRHGLVVGVTGEDVADVASLARADVSLATMGCGVSASSVSSIHLAKQGLPVVMQALIDARRGVQSLKSVAVRRLMLSAHLLGALFAWAMVSREVLDPFCVVLLVILPELLRSVGPTGYPRQRTFGREILNIRKLVSLSFITALAPIGYSAFMMLVLQRFFRSNDSNALLRDAGDYLPRAIFLHLVLVQSWLGLVSLSATPHQLLKPDRATLRFILGVDLVATFACYNDYLIPYHMDPMPISVLVSTWAWSGMTMLAATSIHSVCNNTIEGRAGASGREPEREDSGFGTVDEKLPL